MNRRSLAHSLALLAAITALTPHAIAQDGGASDAAADGAAPAFTHVDSTEHIFGASNVNAMAGHGGLTAGISRDGDVTVLTWPSPSCCDQLLYLASNALDVRSLPHYGALEGMGITTAVAVDLTAGGAAIYWLHDGTWQVDQQYLDDNSLLPVTHFRSNTLDLDVTITDSVPPDVDALQRRIVLTRGPGAAAGTYAMVTFANLAPTQSELPELPVADWILDEHNDFGAVWDAASQSVVHFHPSGRGDIHAISDVLSPAPVDYGSLNALLARTDNDSTAAATFATGIDAEYGTGTYAAVTTVPPPSEHQVGFDSTPFCTAVGNIIANADNLATFGVSLPIPPCEIGLLACTDNISSLRTTQSWIATATDARDDVIANGGHLSGSNAAGGQVDLALRAPLAADGSVTVRIAFAHSKAGATAALAGLPDPMTVQMQDQTAWTTYSATLLVPTMTTGLPLDPGTAALTRVARRALLHDVAGTSRDTGAIVASIARQAPYGYDWPRDGSFFDYAFDVAGDSQRVTRRLEWIGPLMRSQPVQATPLIDPSPPFDPVTMRHDYPANAWETDYTADGTPGGNIRFEIDNTALMVWSMGAHIGYLSEPDRGQVADQLYPLMIRAANLLAAWRDPMTGLDAPASEDDTATYTSTLHGASTVFAALEASARVARYRNDIANAVQWEARAGELRDAILAHYYDPTSGLFTSPLSVDGVINIGSISNGDTAWLVWPAELLPFNDPRITQQLQNDLTAALNILRGQGEGGQYLAKNFLAGAVAVTHGGSASLLPLVQEGIARLAIAVPTQDTQAYGEVYINVGTTTAPVFDQRTANPHLWEGTLTYLAAMALEHPERFDLERMNLPAAQTPPPSDGGVVAADGGNEPVDGGTARDAGIDGGGPMHLTGGCGCNTAGGSGSERGMMACGMMALVIGVARRRKGLLRRGGR